jgi:hypothetical protein
MYIVAPIKKATQPFKYPPLYTCTYIYVYKYVYTYLYMYLHINVNKFSCVYMDAYTLIYLYWEYLNIWDIGIDILWYNQKCHPLYVLTHVYECLLSKKYNSMKHFV